MRKKESLSEFMGDLKIGDELFSIEYGMVTVRAIYDGDGRLLGNSSSATDKYHCSISVNINNRRLKCGIVFDEYQSNGYKNKNSFMKTLFRNKEEAVEYLKNKKVC